MTEKTRHNFIMTSVTVAGGIGEVLRCNKIKPHPPPTTIPERVLGRTGIQVPFSDWRSGSNAALWDEAEIDAV